MSENKAFRNSLIKLAIVCAFAVCYSVGGMGFLPARRFIAPTILCGGMFYFSRDWRCFVQLPLMMFSLALGYGADTVLGKIIKRAIFGFANGATSSTVNIWNKKWLLVGVQIIFITGIYVAFGVFNPLPSARVEELILGLFLGAVPMFSIKEKV